MPRVTGKISKIFLLLTLLLNLITSQNENLCNTLAELSDDEDVCYKKIIEDDGTIKEIVHRCDKDGYECQGSDVYRTCQRRIPGQGNILPGDYCEHGSECKSGECKSDKCKGSEDGGSCKTTYDCDPGLYCDGDECKPVKDFGSSCDSDVECNTGGDCIFGECKQAFSLEIGDEIHSLDQKYMCKTYYAHKDRAGKIRCASLISTENYDDSDPKKEEDEKIGWFDCKPGQTVCEYLVNVGDDQEEIPESLPCQCSLAHKDTMYCPKGTNMPSWIFGKNYLKLAFYRTQFNTHRYSRTKRLNFDDLIPAMKRLKFPRYYDVDLDIVKYYESGKFLKCFSLLFLALVLVF